MNSAKRMLQSDCLKTKDERRMIPEVEITGKVNLGSNELTIANQSETAMSARLNKNRMHFYPKTYNKRASLVNIHMTFR